MKKIPPKFYIVFFLLLAIFVAILRLPLSIPYSLEAPGRVEPLNEWVLVHSVDGIISASLVNHLLDSAESCGNTQAARGDQSTFRFHPGILKSTTVSAGDTIGFVYSYAVELEWAELKGDLGTEQATLRLYESGEKESLVREARLKLEYARLQAEQQRREIKRLSSLAEKEMLPAAEMERQLNQQQLYDVQVKTAEATLNSIETGTKKEELDLIRARIKALQDKIAVMEKRMSFSTIITPISGAIIRSTQSDTLAVIQDTSRYALSLAVKWKDRAHLFRGQTVTLKVDGMPIKTLGKIEFVGNTAYVINGSQLIRAVAIIQNKTPELSSGLLATCSIECRPVRLYEYLCLYFGQ